MKTKKLTLIIAIVLNLAVVVMDAAGNAMELSRSGADMLRYYTVQSNILAQLACLVTAGFLIRGLLRPGAETPRWVTYFKYMAVCTTTVTFLVVVFVLTPMFGGGLKTLCDMLFKGPVLFLHFLCPLAALASLWFLDGGAPLPKKAPLYAMIPTLLYAVVTTILNIARLMEGPYPFLMVYEQPVWASCLWFVVIEGAALLIAWGVYLPLRKKAQIHK